jgi:hypothetical protein
MTNAQCVNKQVRSMTHENGEGSKSYLYLHTYKVTATAEK